MNDARVVNIRMGCRKRLRRVGEGGCSCSVSFSVSVTVIVSGLDFVLTVVVGAAILSWTGFNLCSWLKLSVSRDTVKLPGGFSCEFLQTWCSVYSNIGPV